MARGHGDPPDRLTSCSPAILVRSIAGAKMSGVRFTVRSDEITSEMEPDMIVDCDRCAVRGDACQDCVITVLLGTPPGGVELDGTERWALDTLAEVGMVPRLQLVDRHEAHRTGEAASGCSNHHPDGVKRSAKGVERSRRYVS
jgi:hypothetical protein